MICRSRVDREGPGAMGFQCRRFVMEPGRALADLVARRRFLEVGSSAGLGLSLADLLAAREPRFPPGRKSFGQAHSLVVIFLWGGPGQQDLWDLKPEAPSAVRSEFAPAATNVPGISISDQLPFLARQADKFTLIRSMTHEDFEHGTAAYTALTGQPHPQPGTNTTASPDDFPTYGSVVSRLKSTSQPVPDAVVLGPVMHQGARPPLAGQNAGFLGPGYEPFRIPDDPSAKDFRIDSLSVPGDDGRDRLARRRTLLESLEPAGVVRSAVNVHGMHELYGRAFELLTSPRTQQAFDLERETPLLRERYGRTRFGQTLLLARRLIEARVPLITINWSKLNADQWDTHKNNYPRLRAMLPPFDRGLAMFLEDLQARGLLASTHVVCLGEFGRTPRINKDGGRDHWPDCYSLLVAGGGIQNGRVYGTSNRQAAYPVDGPVAPWDLSATMYHLLGIDPGAHLANRQGQPLPIARGRVVTELL